MVITEFGADTLPGFHSTDELMWSEEFQVAFLRTYLDLVATQGLRGGDARLEPRGLPHLAGDPAAGHA